MRLPELDYLEPVSVEEACAALADDPEGSIVFAGGTDILVDLKEGRRSCRRLVSLGRIEALRRVVCTPEGGLVIGATATVNAVAGHPEVAALYPGVVDAALSLAADQVRNQATVVGNLAMAVPSADMAPILVAHDAVAEIVGPGGRRRLPLRQFFLGPRQNALGPGELVVAVETAPPAPGRACASLRQGGRASLSLPIASAAAVVAVEGERCTDAVVALGAVAPTPIVVEQAGRVLVGRELDDAALGAAAVAARQAARPIDDLRASAAHRRHLVGVLTRRVVVRAAERARGR